MYRYFYGWGYNLQEKKRRMQEILQKKQERIPEIALGISAVLMLTEGWLTWHNGLQRHNSMYLFLLPVMYFLFQLLLWSNPSQQRS